jgi:hypothetical protein
VQALIVAKDGLDPIQIQRRAGPVDQCLKISSICRFDTIVTTFQKLTV